MFYPIDGRGASKHWLLHLVEARLDHLYIHGPRPLSGDSLNAVFQLDLFSVQQNHKHNGNRKGW